MLIPFIMIAALVISLFFWLIILSSPPYKKETLIQIQEGGFSHQENVNGECGPLRFWSWQEIVEIKYVCHSAYATEDGSAPTEHVLRIKGKNNRELEISVGDEQLDLLYTIRQRWLELGSPTPSV